MKLYVISLVVLLSVSFCAYGQNVPTEGFYLKAEGSGEKYGPFVYQDGAKIIIGKHTFVINKLGIAATRSELQAKMERLIIPQVESRNANIIDVVKYLQQQGIIADKESPQKAKGVNIMLNLRGEPVPPITLSLKNISLLDALKYVTEVAGLQYKIDDQARMVYIEPKKSKN